MSIGIKFDKDKLRFDLIPPEIDKWLAEILTYGAKKYTMYCPFGTLDEAITWLKNNNLQNVIQIDQSEPKECVEAVMKRISVKQILNMLKDNEKMLVSGKKLTLNDLQNIENIDLLIQNVEKEIKEQNDKDTLVKNLDYLLKLLQDLKNYKIMPVLFVDKISIQSKPHILITTIKQGNIEDYYVANATTVSDSLMITFNYLQKQFPTCKTLQDLQHSGENNWKKVDAERYWAALYRHLNTFRLGEQNDQESGFCHLHHALCNIAFLAWMNKYECRKYDIGSAKTDEGDS